MKNSPKNKPSLKRRSPAIKDSYYNKTPDFTRHKPSKFRKTWESAKIYLLVIAVAILLYFIFLRLDSLSKILSKILVILSPILYGVVIAYLVNPMVTFIDKRIRKLLCKKFKASKQIHRLSRVSGIVLALAIMIIIIALLLNMVIPELYQTIKTLVYSLPSQVNRWINRLNEIDLGDTTTGTMIMNMINEIASTFKNWISTDFLKQVNVVMGSLTEGVIVAINTIFNVLIGLIISIYLLFSKEQFIAQSKKVLYAFIKPDYAYKIMHITKKSNEIFSGFISGKIIDSAIIGAICFVVMSLFRMPYPLLISVIIGVTNIIPFFGPFIGAVPSTFLILMQSSKTGIYFLIFIILLQQLDGNVIGPKILGNSTGLPAFWVVVAILLGGGLFGFVGMVMGVPTFSVLYYLVQTIVNQRLNSKKLPTHSSSYDVGSYITPKGDYVKPEKEQDI